MIIIVYQEVRLCVSSDGLFLFCVLTAIFVCVVWHFAASCYCVSLSRYSILKCNEILPLKQKTFLF